MDSKEDLLREVHALEKTLEQSASLGDDARPEKVELRRKLAEHRAKISTIGERVFAAKPLQDAFRAEFSKMRAAMALHHASWPIVTIDPRSSQYQVSVQAERDANRRFISWVERHCA